jgi:hypothetical protein
LHSLGCSITLGTDEGRNQQQGEEREAGSHGVLLGVRRMHETRGYNEDASKSWRRHPKKETARQFGGLFSRTREKPTLR